MFSLPAIAALCVVAALALFPDASALPASDMAPDRAALWFLLACALVLQIPAVWKRLVASRDGATWALLCAFFVLFQIAQRAGPRLGFSLHFSWAPADPNAPIIVPWATGAVLLGALCSLPLWIKRGGAERGGAERGGAERGGAERGGAERVGAERFVLLGLFLVGLFGLGMFRFLSGFFPIDETGALAPSPMVTLLLQIVSYGALALCCRAAVAGEPARALVLRALPILLLLVAARHQFAPLAAPKTDE